MFRRLLSVGAYTALSRVTGFLRDILMAAILGAGPMSDAFLVAFRLPNNFRAIFGEGAFNAAFVQRYVAQRANQGEEAAQAFADRVFSWQMAAQLVLLIAALAGMTWIIEVMAPGFAAHPGQVRLATDLARIAFPYLIFTLVAVQLSAMLNAIGKFAAAAAWSIFLNLTMAATLLAWFWFPTWFPNAAYAAAWGVLLGGVAQLLFIVWAAARSGLTLHIGRPRWTRDVRDFVIALGAATVGSASVQISLFVDNLIASFLPSGDLTALYYADRINQLPMGTLGIALGTVLLPEMSERLARGDRAGADAAQNRAAATGLLLTLPFVAAYLAVPLTIMLGLFHHGAFHLQAAALSADALTAYGIGLPAFVLVRVMAPTFYARGDTATPVRATISAVIANVALKILLVWGLHWGAVGIALGTALGAWVNLGILFALAQARGLVHLMPSLRTAILPILTAAAATGIAARAGVELYLRSGLQVRVGHLSDEAALAIAILFGATAYAAMVLLWRGRLPLPRLRRAT